jgi:hypothetical protein
MTTTPSPATSAGVARTVAAGGGPGPTNTHTARRRLSAWRAHRREPHPVRAQLRRRPGPGHGVAHPGWDPPPAAGSRGPRHRPRHGRLRGGLCDDRLHQHGQSAWRGPCCDHPLLLQAGVEGSHAVVLLLTRSCARWRSWGICSSKVSDARGEAGTFVRGRADLLPDRRPTSDRDSSRSTPWPTSTPSSCVSHRCWSASR